MDIKHFLQNSVLLISGQPLSSVMWTVLPIRGTGPRSQGRECWRETLGSQGLGWGGVCLGTKVGISVHPLLGTWACNSGDCLVGKGGW